MADFNRDGCIRFSAAVPTAAVVAMRGMSQSLSAAGERLSLSSQLVAAAVDYLDSLAHSLRTGLRPVRAVLLDKTEQRNWSVPWHQDRTIAVAGRRDAIGFGPWSRKAGVTHVEPPFSLLSAMLTLRLHLDDCGDDNAPLIVALGSHQGRVASAEAAQVAERSVKLTCLASAGDVWMYATPILHMSLRSSLPRRRRVLQLDYCADQLPCGLRWAE